ncbi:hypothetical protein B4U80_13115 [Leptotrombidium deliense]|uniref:chorismate mutase n=1 Tax=Leptotrombidium deliense TaxID=299467 RepID=A0A443SCE4_9ACAR|nr:hypothetical protein B4U80_13115 [Leptotrombidium deliense]
MSCFAGGSEEHTMYRLNDLITRRLLLSYYVAAYKQRYHLPIEDRARESQILDAMAAKASTYGLGNVWSKNFFQDQIDASKYVQNGLINDWKVNGQNPYPKYDLDTTRKMIDTLNTQIIEKAAETKEYRKKRECDDLVRKYEQNVRLDLMYKHALEMALKHVCGY